MAMRLLVLLMVLAFPISALAEGEGGPTAVVEQLNAGVVEIMKAAATLDAAGRRERFAALLPVYLDQPYMASKSVGREWKKLTPEQQEQLVASFLELSILSYVDRFQGYSGERFLTIAEEIDEKGRAKVESKVVTGEGEEFPLSYRLHQSDGRWLIYDVFLNGSVSEMAMRRSEFSSVLKREGFENLIAAIDEKSEKLSQSSSE